MMALTEHKWINNLIMALTDWVDSPAGTSGGDTLS